MTADHTAISPPYVAADEVETLDAYFRGDEEEIESEHAVSALYQ